MRKELKEVKEQAKWLSGGRTLQAQRILHTTTLGCVTCLRNSKETNAAGGEYVGRQQDDVRAGT